MKGRFAQWSTCALVLGALLLFQGCGSSQSRYLAPQYEQGGSPGASVAILPLSSDLLPDSAGNSGTTMGAQNTHFNREGRELFYRLFDLELQDVVAGPVTSFDSDFEPGSVFRRQMLPMGSSDSLSIPVPKGSISLSGSVADFVLLIDDLRFRSVSKQVREGAMGSANRRTETHLIATCQYLLWDNERARPAAYGRFKGTTRVQSPTSRSHYVNLYERLANDVIVRSPIPISRLTDGRRAR